MVDVDLREIVSALGGELRLSNPEAEVPRIARIGALDSAESDSIAFLSSRRWISLLPDCRAACVIIAPGLLDRAGHLPAVIVTADPYLYYARLTQWWVQLRRPTMAAQVHSTAVVDAQAVVGHGVTIGAFTVVEAHAVLGDGVEVGAHGFIGRHAQIGENSRLAARVTLGEHCRLGARAVVHSGAVIGADGFGFAPSEGRWEKIEQLGAVRIGDDVEIGANTCIDRGALGDTVIEEGVKLDNLIQIGHNVRIGAHSALAGCVGVAGSAVIGRHCTVGGAGMVLGHLQLADDVHISAASLVTRSILKPGQYTGVFPIDDNAAWEKNAATLRQLHALRDRLRALESAAIQHKPEDDTA